MHKTHNLKRTTSEENVEIKAKLALLESDKKAYYESCKQALEDCKDHIIELRRENNKLRVQNRERLSADDYVISQSFQNKPTERAMLINKTTEVAVSTMDNQVCDSVRKLNALKHVTHTKQMLLEDIKFRYNVLYTDSLEAQATTEGINKEGQALRNLENRFDKARLKCRESEYIKEAYELIKARLEEEHLDYGNKLDAMENEIKKACDEIIELKALEHDSILARDSAVLELKIKEDMIFNERRRRELELYKIKQVAYEKHLTREKLGNRIATSDSISNIDKDLTTITNDIFEYPEKRVFDYETTFRTIKEVLGVKDLKEMVIRFENQVEKKAHLETLKNESEKTITKLKEKQFELHQNYIDIEYTGESKRCTGLSQIKDFKKYIEEQNIEKMKINDEIKRSHKLMVLCKSGIEHIYDKLKTPMIARGTFFQAQTDYCSTELNLETLNIVGEKLDRLMNKYSKYNIKGKMKEMKKAVAMKFMNLVEFQKDIEVKVSANNLRIKLPQAKMDVVYEDEESREDDLNTGVLTRIKLKKLSQQLVDMKSKRKISKKKKTKAK